MSAVDGDDDFDILDDWLDLTTYDVDNQSSCLQSRSRQRFSVIRSEDSYSPATSESSTSTLSTDSDEAIDTGNDSEINEVDKVIPAIRVAITN